MSFLRSWGWRGRGATVASRLAPRLALVGRAGRHLRAPGGLGPGPGRRPALGWHAAGGPTVEGALAHGAFQDFSRALPAGGGHVELHDEVVERSRQGAREVLDGLA